MAILEGLITGVGTIIFIGPVLFTLLQITLDHGRKAGILVALGILFSDIVIVALFYAGAIDFFKEPFVQIWLALVGSIILFALGLKYIVRPYAPGGPNKTLSFIQSSGHFTKGFLVNFINPFVFFVWISLITIAEGRFESNWEVLTYLCFALLGIILTDVSKVLLADKLHRFLRPEVLKKIFLAIGMILIGFGIRLLYFFVSHSL